MELADKKVLVIGMARSGISAAKLCRKLGAVVTIYDGKDRQNFKEQLGELENYSLKYSFGEFNRGLLSNLDYMILSPGVPTDLWFIEEAKAAGIDVCGEVELAYNYCESDIVGITGTNGKTTTTTLVGEIVERYFESTHVVGNIGIPFSDVVLETKASDIIVAEISSFQLESIKNFRPKVSAILNITEDHLNRHKTFDNYVEAKLLITKNQHEEDCCILNYDDEVVRALAPKITSKILWFSMKERVEGIYCEGDSLYLNVDSKVSKVLEVSDIFVLGKHNIENVMAAFLMSYVLKVPVETIQEGIKAFRGVKHRNQYVATVKGVKYYNDSKATNPDAAIKALDAMVTPTVLIAGGMNKNSNYEEWINAFGDKVKILVLFGETKEDIKTAANKVGFYNIEVVNDLEEAVKLASTLVDIGDSVLLSPACASWDMFRDYEQRGDLFIEIVHSL